jgi:hypothetical protein
MTAQKTVIKQAIELLEIQKNYLQEMELLGVLLKNEFAHKSNQINSTQLLLAKLIPIFEEQIKIAYIDGSIDIINNTHDKDEYYSKTFEN